MALETSFKEAVQRLHNRDAQAFKEFVAALESRYVATALRATEMDTDNVLASMGRARELKQLLRDINDCLVLLAKTPAAP